MTFLFAGLALVVSIFMGRFLYRLMFADSEDFWNCVGFAFTPDLFSLFKGEYFEDKFKSFKLSAFLLMTGGAGFLTYWGLTELFR